MLDYVSSNLLQRICYAFLPVTVLIPVGCCFEVVVYFLSFILA